MNALFRAGGNTSTVVENIYILNSFRFLERTCGIDGPPG